MADFKPILVEILKSEGGWVDDPQDNGGETWQGVARNINPNWSGWSIIDDIKRLNPKTTKLAYSGNPKPLNAMLYASTPLKLKVEIFYKSLYWDVNKLDLIKDQQLAKNICDCGVNCGTGTAARMLQKAYNNCYSPFDVLSVDGKIGNTTLAKVNAVFANNIYNEYNKLRKAYYDAIIARNPSQVKYKASWYSRIIPYRS